MTKETLDELERLHEAATPGPWGATINPASAAFGQVDGAAWGVCTVNHDDDRRPCSERDPEFDPLKHAVEDAQLIAAARNALPELLRSARLALELAAILGDDPVGKAKALTEELRVARFCADEEKERADSNFKSCERIRDKYSAEVNEHAATRATVESLRAALAEKEAARQSLACFALNLAWQNGWTATPEEADPDAALDYVSSKLKELKDAADLETNELLSELRATNSEQAAKVSNLLEENAALAEKNAEAKRWKADYHAACNELAKARGKYADIQLRLDFLAFDRDEEAEQRGGQFAKLWAALKAAVKRAEVAEELWRLNPPHELVLHCPNCGKQHLDIGEFATRVHRKHLCENTTDGPGTGCGHVWRPFEYATKGVRKTQEQRGDEFRAMASDYQDRHEYQLERAESLVEENDALRAGEPEAVRYMRMQRDVFCEKLNEKIDHLSAADKENARLRARVAELEPLAAKQLAAEAETHDDALAITPARLAELEQEANASTNIPGPVTQRELRELLRVYRANVSRCDSDKARKT